MGVERILGIDGEYVRRDQLLIPKDRFLASDLSTPPRITAKFDLTVCLEVAEHLTAQHAVTLVDFLTHLAPVILFSAAIPYQGGTNHVNEQWPDYWAKIFEKRDFIAIDCLRPRIWEDDDVAWWYAQNMLLFVKKSKLRSFTQLTQEEKLWGGPPRNIVHPKMYSKWVEWTQGMYEVDREITRLLQGNDTFIFLDEGQLITPSCGKARRFLERDGVYCGPPPSDDIAIKELQHMILKRRP